MKRAVFLDRDGVLNAPEVRDGRSRAPLSLDAFRIYPWAKEAVGRLREAGFLTIVVTNQPEVATGELAPDALDAIHARLREVLAVDAVYACPHVDADGCACRKPRPGLLLRAAADWNIDVRASFMVGDRWRDIGAGGAAGCTTILVAGGERGDAHPDHEAGDLRDAVATILGGPMRSIPCCPVCESPEYALVYPATLRHEPAEAWRDPYGAHYQINRCVRCSLVLSSPILGEREVDALYRTSTEGNVTPGEEANVRRTMQMYYALARPHLEQRERMLDVGCDVGFLLDVARADGFQELHGIEPNPAARRVAETIGGAVISDRFYEETAYPERHFDLITMIHVLDHLVDPRRTLDRALRDLKPGGVMVAVVHNVESLLGRVLGERFPVFNLYHHYFFTKRTLRLLFEARGFGVLRTTATRNRYSLGFFARRVPGLPPSAGDALRAGLGALGLAKLPLTVPLGNIGVVARRPR